VPMSAVGPARLLESAPSHSHPGRLDVAVLDASGRAALVCARSLGRAGLRVGAFDRQPAPAFRSRWVQEAGLLPDFVAEPAAYAEALLALVDSYAPQALIPVHDGSIEVIRAHRSELERRVAIALAPEPQLAVAIDKAQTFAVAQSIGVALPRSVSLDRGCDVEAALAEVGSPAVVKPLRSFVEGSEERLMSRVVSDATELRAMLALPLWHEVPLVLQQWASGSREAVWLFYAQGKIWARCAQIAERMNPPLGGASVVRESIVPNKDVLESSERLVREIGLEGFSEVEFRRDLDGRPLLMEINPRLSASIELGVRAGIDFPGLLYAWATGRPLHQAQSYRVGIRMRWLGGDLRWLRATLRAEVGPDIPPRSVALARFVRDSVRPTGYDYLVPSDPLPALYASWDLLRRGVTLHRVAPGAARGEPA
jgi:predicted ATP-grasp superfamily ATP-dependent carboligase